MKVYLSSGMRGYPDLNFPAFNEKAAELRAKGMVVVNPAENFAGSQTVSRAECMAQDIRLLLGCDALVVFGQWEDSPGAKVEVVTAWSVGLPVLDFKTLEPIKVHDLRIPSEQQYHDKRPLVAFTGFARSGKDSAAACLIKSGWERVSFADEVRRALLPLNPYISERDCALLELIREVGWDVAKETHTEVRSLLQRMGTETGRKILGGDIWVTLAERKIDLSGKPVVITDTRFHNEFDMVRRRGGLIVRVTRRGIGPVNGHLSEKEMQNEQADFTIKNDGSLADLRGEVESILPELVFRKDPR